MTPGTHYNGQDPTAARSGTRYLSLLTEIMRFINNAKVLCTERYELINKQRTGKKRKRKQALGMRNAARLM
jgi:hypothetical protein